MIRMLFLSSSIAALLASPAGAAWAAGPFDGTWEVDAAATGQTGPTKQESGCEALRLQFTVKNNQIHGSLARSPHNPSRVTPSGRGATPVTGTVQPDGTVNAQWQSFKATGKLTGDKAELRWRGSCGPRVAMGGRIAASTEGAGSSTGSTR